MNNQDPFGEQKLNKIQLMIYFIPLIGWIPALWTLYRRQSSGEQRSVSRLSVRITLVWILLYGLLWLGSASSSELISLRLLYFNGLLTSGYILVCLAYIIRLWQGKNIGLPPKS
jgi:hypothetical protein